MEFWLSNRSEDYMKGDCHTYVLPVPWLVPLNTVDSWMSHGPSGDVKNEFMSHHIAHSADIKCKNQNLNQIKIASLC